ncbi:ribosomal protection-like ABC-F family protein [Paenibacillus lignilyticus]|uniref:ABC-F family ATP-binding cassette domain-containing protein n=1 Tax=Paenibacillus lignilyticus TaxID=1172615 RepID=A0ABS5CII9_9BACL|nr:ABC-F family ATP-binding cassette domain-containing protein [Paenibacillus lignilyticus]MBP3965621.1 ABC-F family ATP-binding cassette domain-containing protein [Paenibacillus lignilyticus]
MLLQVSDISKSYGVSSVLSSITFQVQPRERVGLVGVNGAGKSTLLRIIAGEMSADSGTIYKSKETTIGYLAQSSGLQSDQTIDAEMHAVFAHLTEAEQELRALEQQIADPKLHEDAKQYEAVLNRYSTLSDWFREKGGFEVETKIRGILHGMGFGQFPPDTIISTLSGGQKTRLALARILLQSPDLLMLDEPTNYLDIETLTWLEDYLRGYDGGILVVSHDRYFLDAVVQTIVEIERHTAKRYTGNYSRYIEIKAAEYEAQMKQFDKQQDEIAKLEDFVQRNIVRASTTKRAQSRRKALEKMDRIDKPLGDLKKAHFSFEIERQSGNDVLDVRDLSITFQEKSDPLFQNVSFRLERGENVALIGPNGIGKSTLLKSLVGQQAYEHGTIRWGTNVKIGYYDQEHTGLNHANTVLEELWGTYPSIEEARIRTVLGNFLFSGDDVKKRISSLSGGERARVSLSKLMLARANMLILDEPTNHLDLYSKEVLESALMDYDGTLLFISHDRYFLNKMAERIVELEPQGTQHFLGNYDEMIQKKRENDELQLETLSFSQGKQGKPTAAPDPAPVSSYEADKQAKRDERNRQRKQEQLEKEIARLEGEITAFEEQLVDPEIYNDYVRVQSIQTDLDALKAQLQTVYESWEELLA